MIFAAVSSLWTGSRGKLRSADLSASASFALTEDSRERLGAAKALPIQLSHLLPGSETHILRYSPKISHLASRCLEYVITKLRGRDTFLVVLCFSNGENV